MIITGSYALVSVYQSIFINNTASRNGGAITFNGEHSEYTISGSTFVQNSANYCGALSIIDTQCNSIIITDSAFYYNRAVSVVDIGGGAACARNASVLISNCIFIGNMATGNGGAMLSDGSTIVITNTVFANNTSGHDGGALITHAHPSNYSITHSSFNHNQAGDDEGAVFIGRRGSFVRVERCNFTNNHAADKGGVITIFGSAAEIIETNMYDNTADLGETIISCNSTVETSIPSQTDPNISFCSYYAANIDHFNTAPTLLEQNHMNTAFLNITIRAICVEYQQSKPATGELYGKLNMIIVAAYTSLTISITLAIAVFLYIIVTKLISYQSKKRSTEQAATCAPSEPLYEEAIVSEKANNEVIVMKPNVVYGRCESQDQAQ